ncbi:MAG: DUF2220 family protein [Gammaproteobacteria bacterium]|nr:DUF2220 family protein [Gammaproteobacteria bacterium]
MKSPEQLAEKLSRQWYNANIREQRLLTPDSWPLELNIGKPSATALKQNLEKLRKHLERWRTISIGDVIWEKIKYRDSQEAIDLPIRWQLNKPSDWIDATTNRAIKVEFQKLANIVSTVAPQFHTLLIRQRHLIADKDEAEIIQACELAMQLKQDSAKELPLRAFSLAGIDSKFFERNRHLLIKLLDIRFSGLVSEIGLEAFLGALNERDHWLLVVDLDGTILPFKQIRLRDSELKTTPLSTNNILIIENERCLHQLPKMKNTIAILGAGLNLSWMDAPWLNEKKIAYWGDIDTWGLTMLAHARRHQPALTALLMSEEIYLAHCANNVVAEPKTAGDTPAEGLTTDESKLYQHLLSDEKGRLEQEFLPPVLVRKAVLEWKKS